MGFHHFANVERLETFEKTVPDDRDQTGRRNDLRKFSKLLWNFAASSSVPQHRAHRGNDAGKDLAVVKFSKFWKSPPLGDDEADHVLAPRFVDLAHEQFDDAIGNNGKRQVCLAHRLDRADDRRQHCAHKLLKERLLVPEVEVDRSFGDAGTSRHVIKSGGFETAGGEFVECGCKNSVATFRAARPASRAGWNRRRPRGSRGALASGYPAIGFAGSRWP